MDFIDLLHITNIEKGGTFGMHRTDTPSFEFLCGEPAEAREYFISLCSDNRYIYALHKGHMADPEELSYGDRILVFDWEGNPVCQFNLPVKVNNMTLDYASPTIYAVNDMDEKFYKIDVSL